jgi:hypothetical protein
VIACPACGAPNDLGFTWCQQCGRRLADAPPRSRVPFAAAAALVVCGLAAFAVIGNLVSAANAGGRIEVANIGVTVPAGWAVEATEPGQVLMSAQGGAGILLLSVTLPTRLDARTAAMNEADGFRQASPEASRCAEPEPQAMPGLEWGAYRVVECGVGDQSIAVLAAMAPDGKTAFVVAISGFPDTLAQIEDVFARRIAPTIEWKLKAGVGS